MAFIQQDQQQQPQEAPAPVPAPRFRTGAELRDIFSGAAPPPAPPPPTAPAPVPAPTGGAKGGSIFSPLSQGVQQAQLGLQQASEAFREAAGPSRTFQGLGGSEIVQRAIQGDQDAFQQTADLLGSRFAGPSGLATESVGALRADLGDLRARADILGTGAGLTSALQQATPALTRGQARFEAQRRLRGPEFQEQLAAQRREIEDLATLLGAQETGARDFAERRQQEEADIARLAREQLEAAQGETRAGIEQRAADIAARQAAAADLFERIQADPQNEALLRQAQERGLLGGDGADELDPLAELFRVNRGRERAQSVIQEIMDDPRFAAIADVGSATGQRVSGRANQQFTIGDNENLLKELRSARREDKRAGEKGLSVKKRRKLFDERQAAITEALEKEGLREIAPQVLGPEGVEQADVRNFLSFDPGDLPNFDNAASEDQREKFNRISELLQLNERIADTDPARAAALNADLENFMKDQETRIERKRGELTEAEESFRKDIKRARRELRKAKSLKGIRGVGRVVGDVLAPGTGLGRTISRA